MRLVLAGRCGFSSAVPLFRLQLGRASRSGRMVGRDGWRGRLSAEPDSRRGATTAATAVADGAGAPDAVNDVRPQRDGARSTARYAEADPFVREIVRSLLQVESPDRIDHILTTHNISVVSFNESPMQIGPMSDFDSCSRDCSAAVLPSGFTPASTDNISSNATKYRGHDHRQPRLHFSPRPATRNSSSPSLPACAPTASRPARRARSLANMRTFTTPNRRTLMFKPGDVLVRAAHLRPVARVHRFTCPDWPNGAGCFPTSSGTSGRSGQRPLSRDSVRDRRRQARRHCATR